MKFVAVALRINKQAGRTDGSHASPTRTHPHVGTTLAFSPLSLTRVDASSIFLFLPHALLAAGVAGRS